MSSSMHPRKEASIKVKVVKLLKSGFIYLIPLTYWVSNIDLLTKNMEPYKFVLTIEISIEIVLRIITLLPSSTKLLTSVWGVKFSFMDEFSGYNQINILPTDQHKAGFICPWGTLSYKKIPFGPKNTGATFQWALSYSFHNIKNIIHPYLDDLPALLLKHQDHPTHLRAVFLCCRH